MDKMPINVSKCARCGKDHSELVFNTFTRPIIEEHKVIASHWAMCPTLNEPILMLVRYTLTELTVAVADAIDPAIMDDTIEPMDAEDVEEWMATEATRRWMRQSLQ